MSNSTTTKPDTTQAAAAAKAKLLAGDYEVADDACYLALTPEDYVIGAGPRYPY